MKKLAYCLLLIPSVCFAGATPQRTFIEIKQVFTSGNYAGAVSLIDSASLKYSDDVIHIQAMGNIELPDREYYALSGAITVDYTNIAETIIKSIDRATQLSFMLNFASVQNVEIDSNMAEVTITGGYTLQMVQEGDNWKLYCMDFINDYLSIDPHMTPRLLFYHYVQAIQNQDYATAADYFFPPNAVQDPIPSDTEQTTNAGEQQPQSLSSDIENFARDRYTRTAFAVTAVDGNEAEIKYTLDGNCIFAAEQYNGKWFINPATIQR